MRTLWWSSAVLIGAGVLAALVQSPGTRLTYRVRVMDTDRVLGKGAVSGPFDTGLRLTLRGDSMEVEALFQIAPVADTVTVGAEFVTRRLLVPSRRRLPLWEEDTYHRTVRMSWSDTVRIHPFGRPGSEPATTPWVELTLERGFAGGAARPAELLELADSLYDFRVEAVLRPRRARVTLNLVRGDSVSGPRPMDLIPQGPSRTVRLVLGPRATSLDVRLVPPVPARTLRERVLALDADVVCLRVAGLNATVPLGHICGSLNNVGRRLPLPNGDTLVATFAWPGPR